MTVPLLDHIIIVLPQSKTSEELLDHAQPFTKYFNLSKGGFHTSGRTQNVLISIEDGTYIELVAFTSTPDESDTWGQRTPTRIVDFALLGRPDHGKKAYDVGNPGGRGECRWIVTMPKKEWRLGKVPFWCEDITARELRVPTPPEHPSGISAVKRITILVNSLDQQEQLVTLYQEILGNHDLKLGTLSGGQVDIVIRKAETEEEQKSLERDGAGIYKVEFNVPEVVLSNPIL